MNEALTLVVTFLVAYLIGSIPFAYVIVKAVTGDDITAHGTGNVGAMNVRRSTGSWGWFVVALLADAAKGLVPVALAKTGLFVHVGTVLTPTATLLATPQLSSAAHMTMVALAGSVVGHNYSLWMALLKRGFHRTGKGLATGGGALLAYDWRYFIVVIVVGLATIAVTRYMMAGQVAAAASLPVAAVASRSADWQFALLMGAVVYLAHHKRFVGMLRGEEPKLYVNDRMGPRG